MFRSECNEVVGVEPGRPTVETGVRTGGSLHEFVCGFTAQRDSTHRLDLGRLALRDAESQELEIDSIHVVVRDGLGQPADAPDRGLVQEVVVGPVVVLQVEQRNVAQVGRRLEADHHALVLGLLVISPHAQLARLAESREVHVERDLGDEMARVETRVPTLLHLLGVEWHRVRREREERCKGQELSRTAHGS